MCDHPYRVIKMSHLVADFVGFNLENSILIVCVMFERRVINGNYRLNSFTMADTSKNKMGGKRRFWVNIMMTRVHKDFYLLDLDIGRFNCTQFLKCEHYAQL